MTLGDSLARWTPQGPCARICSAFIGHWTIVHAVSGSGELGRDAAMNGQTT